jgi:hypothetical protein
MKTGRIGPMITVGTPVNTNPANSNAINLVCFSVAGTSASAGMDGGHSDGDANPQATGDSGTHLRCR